MKFMHISDLHIGRSLETVPLYEDQEYILKQISETAEKEGVSAVVIAGDIYDKSMPSARSMEILDAFLTDLSRKGIKVLAISGNHDSQERVNYGARLFKENGIYIAGEVEAEVKKVEIDGVEFYLLPYIRPLYVKKYHADEDIATHARAVELMLEGIAPKKPSVIIAHQFVISAKGETKRTDSEISVGGTEGIDASLFEKFDYTALGHLHRAQCIGSERVRYCGTPLKYSKSEANDRKSVTIVDTDKDMEYTTVELKPLHEVRAIRGKIAELIKAARETCEISEDYVYATLTDEDVTDAAGQLRSVYPNLVSVTIDNERNKYDNEIGIADIEQGIRTEEMFAEFFALQNNRELSDEERAVIAELLGGEEA